MNRAARRKLAAQAPHLSRIMAASALDLTARKPVPVSQGPALLALERGFRLLLRTRQNGPVAIPLSQAEATAFPNPTDPGLVRRGASWLAVGLDPDGRGCWAVETVAAFHHAPGDAARPLPGPSHDGARERALATVRRGMATRGLRASGRQEVRPSGAMGYE